MVKVVGNLKELIDQSAAGYIANNKEDFKSVTPGPRGIDGPVGPQGVGVHHLKGTSTTQDEGDFTVAGETDTYTFYPDANETYPLGWFRIKNGEDPYKKAQERGFIGTEVEFYTMLANVDEYYVSVSEMADVVSEQSAQVALDAAQVEVDAAQVAADRLVVAADRELTVDSANVVQGIFLGAKTSDPTTDNHGNPLVAGTMYYNLVSLTLRIWNGVEWNLGAFSVAGAVVSFNGRDGAISLTNADVTSAVGKDLTGAVLYGDADKVLTDVNKVSLSTDTSIVAGVGELTWNNVENTVDVGLNGATLQVGQEQLIRVRNNSGVSIANGMVVMATGSIGNSGRITVAKANVNQGTAKTVLGIVTEMIADGADGFVTTFGKVRGIQTNGGQYGESWVDGDILYVKDSDSGALTKVVPTDSQVKIPIAMVVNAHGSNGTLFVRVTAVDENSDKLSIASKAPLVSPALTGIPTAPTASFGTSSTQVATTAYVVAALNTVVEW